MKISYVYPYEITQTPIEVNLNEDFVKIPVGMKGVIESNKFLVSLWNQFNRNISPYNSPDRAPWAYFPGRFLGKKSHALVLGFLQTDIGELYIALSYRSKGDIDAIHFHNPKGVIKPQNEKILNDLVLYALKEKDNTMRFLCLADIIPQVDGFVLETYVSSSFCLSQAKDKNRFFIEFYVDAIDKFEGEQVAMERLYDICAFLSVETNIRMTFDTFEVSDGVLLYDEVRDSDFCDDYIDYYPMKEGWRLYLSRYAISFIEKYIISTPRFQDRPSVIKYFLSACKHIQLGMEAEEKLNIAGMCSIPKSTFSLSKVGTKSKMENMTSSMMSYLSAIECASASDVSGETCEVCGAVKYKISSRVKGFTSKYLGEDLGKVFHRLYGYRSKFLHAGRFPSDANVVRTLPLLSDASVSGLLDLTGISVNLNGKIIHCAIQNVREWSTYVLRCYYQEQFCSRKLFSEVFSMKRNLKLPIEINAVSPDGADLMTKSFIVDSKAEIR